MGNSFSISCDQLVPPFLRYLCLNNLEDNLEDLQADMQRLSERRDDLLKRVSRAEDSRLGLLPEVETWISRVRKTESEANRLLDESVSVIPRLSMYGYCSLISKSTYEYSKKVDMMSKEVKSLIWRGAFEVVSPPHPTTPVEEVPVVTTTASQEKLLQDIWNRLLEKNVGTLGIYGMGGVGKTTLLKQLNNKFAYVSGECDLVMFVGVASREIEDLQDDIGSRLGILWGLETKKEKATKISGVLRRKRFILLLDDVQKEIDLEAIGVPFPKREDGCKIVFTTRIKELCRAKWVDTSERVECLPPNEAWDLFQKTVGRHTLTSHPGIPELARIAAEKCHGLPLALRVIGESMSRKRTIEEWRHAIHVLISSWPEHPGPEDEISSILKFSYDALRDEIMKKCFLYCALFPEGFDVRRQDLVNYWVGEGLVSDDIKGYEIISDLVSKSLLIEDNSGYGVKMHKLVRKMALWISSDLERQKELFVVNAGDGIQDMPEISDWSNVTRMSVTFTRIVNLSDSPYYPKLTTLFLQHNNLKHISGDFFRRMVSLVLLDLSHNKNLFKLPEEVSCLVSLRLLNLSGTGIKDLPNGLRVLIQLIHLDLESTPNLSSISLISGLLKLQVLRFYGSGAALDISLLKNLERLKDLKLLTITVREVDVLKTFLRSRLSGCTQGLSLEGIKVSGVSGQSFEATLGALSSLRNVEVVNCDIIKDLTWLIYAANLESLRVETSPKMEEVISEEKAAGVNVEPFLKLQVLHLENLPSLKSIFWSSLSFPRLRKVGIKNCPSLHKLPFNSTSVEKIDDLDIEVDERWLDRVEWEDGAEDRFRHVIRTASVSQLHQVL